MRSNSRLRNLLKLRPAVPPLHRWVSRRMWWVCVQTLRLEMTLRLTGAEGLSPFVMEKVKRVAEVHSEATRAAHGAGLKILAGTDPVLPRMHGRNYMELVALMDEGLSSLDAWYAGTGLAATEIGQDDAGSLRPGQRADLLICDADVIEQPRSLDPEHGAALVEVLKDGIGHRGGLTGLPQTTYSGAVRPFLWPEARG